MRYLHACSKVQKSETRPHFPPLASVAPFIGPSLAAPTARGMRSPPAQRWNVSPRGGTSSSKSGAGRASHAVGAREGAAYDGRGRAVAGAVAGAGAGNGSPSKADRRPLRWMPTRLTPGVLAACLLLAGAAAGGRGGSAARAAADGALRGQGKGKRRRKRSAARGWAASGLRAAPSPSSAPLSSAEYAASLLTGRYLFSGSSGCRSGGDSEREGKAFPCVIYYPEVELSDHLEREEALDPGIGLAELLGLGGTHVPDPIPAVLGRAVPIEPPGADADVAVLTRHGYKAGAPDAGRNGHRGQINQDRIVAVSPYRLRLGMGSDSDPAGREDDDDFLLALFDGHGMQGHAISELALRTFPALLANKLEGSKPAAAVDLDDDEALDEAVAEAATAAYAYIDARATLSGAGSTATSVLRLGDRIHFINAGDSRSFLSTYVRSTGRVEIAFQTSDHKPDVPGERARIEAMGGQVVQATHSSRVLAYLPDGKQVGLAMSRSLGDPDADVVGVISTPDVTSLSLRDVRSRRAEEDGVPLDDVELFAVVGSDGLHDHIDPKGIASFLAEGFYREAGSAGDSAGGEGGRHGPFSPLRACEELIMRSSAGWAKAMDYPYRDDISIAAARVFLQ